MTQSDTRTALLRAAERLFAREGIDVVSLRRIAIEAGQANHSAVAYHFRDKKELIDALLSRHSAPIEAAWSIAVPHLQAEGRGSLRELVALLVRPLAAKLDDSDGGPEYLNIVAQLVTSTSFPILQMSATQAPGILALTGALMMQMPPFPPPLMPLRMMRVTATLYCSLSDYARWTAMGLDVPRPLFVDDLITSLVGLLRGDAGG